MKKILTIVFCLTTLISTAQQVIVPDSDATGIQSSTSYNLNNRQKESAFLTQNDSPKHYAGRDRVVFATRSFAITGVENEIFEREVQECNAMMKRDEEALKNICLRDFSLDEPADPLIKGLPYYAHLSRMVQNYHASGDLVFTSGVEEVQKLKHDGKLDAGFRREFFHTWTRTAGGWKLSIKTYKPLETNTTKE